MTDLSPHLESMTVLDDLNFASGGVESRNAMTSPSRLESNMVKGSLALASPVEQFCHGHSNGSDTGAGGVATTPLASNSPSPLTPDGCLENGIARLGTHNAEQPGKAVSDALADGQFQETPQTSRRTDERVGCDTAPVEAHTSRQLLEDAA